MTNGMLPKNLLVELDMLRELKEDLDAIMEHTFDLVCILDSEGKYLRVSSAFEEFFGLKASDVIGCNAKDLESKGVLSRSISHLIHSTHRKETILQETCTGKRLLVTGVPVFDNEGKLSRILALSRDITQTELLKSKLAESEELIAYYQSELKKYRDSRNEVITRSPKMEAIFDLAQRVAQSDSTVLITGESGVGKEVLAKSIHEFSQRRKGPFVKINCGAIPEALLESELFGYEKGAFTGANQAGKPGLISMANHGTLFLDEIGEMPLPMQVKLLQVLQEKRFIKLGDTKPIQVDVRVITATNRNLEELVQQGRFRQDLFYRLNVVPLYIPPLRERLEEIPVLLNAFLLRLDPEKPKKISPKAMEALTRYGWPGNVRELENLAERLHVTCPNDVIESKDLPEHIRYGQRMCEEIVPLKEALERLEKDLILSAVSQYGSGAKAAKVLGVNQSTISRKLKAYKQSK